MGHGLLFDALIYLSAAGIAVPLAKRWGLGSGLGYLLALCRRRVVFWGRQT